MKKKQKQKKKKKKKKKKVRIKKEKQQKKTFYHLEFINKRKQIQRFPVKYVIYHPMKNLFYYVMIATWDIICGVYDFLYPKYLKIGTV